MSDRKKPLYDVYSVTQINCYLKCPQQYKYRYIDGLPSRLSSAAWFGISAHGALEHNFEQKIFSKKDLPANKVVDVFANQMETEKDTIDWEGKFRDEIDMGKWLLTEYVNEYARVIKPKAVEKKVEIEISGVSKPFLGYVDLLNSDSTIMDFKTTSRAPSPYSMKNHLLQLTGYAYSLVKLQDSRDVFTEEEAAKIKKARAIHTRMDFMVKTKTPKIIPKPIKRTIGDMKRFVGVVQAVTAAIEAGAFYPNFTSPLCNPKYCSYYEKCQKDYNEDSFLK